MKTTNIISTPNIEGNIGSCEAKQIESPIAKGIIIDKYQVTITNSCTGEIVNQYQYTDYGWVGFWIFIIALFVIFGLSMGLGGNKEHNPEFYV